MKGTAKNIIWATVFAFIAAILQSTLLAFVTVHIHFPVPDLVLGIIVFTAYINGAMTGQITGFFSGLLLDFLSAAPLGLNAFIRTLIGALTGLLRGTFFLDVLFLPMILCGCATIFKALILFFLHFLFPETIPVYSVFQLTFWFELLLNTLLAPLLFGFLKLFKALLIERRQS
ncbi:MAG: rod shape-determining protein MreD [Treponema sp.]|jgi:rod shape-determining protein MreD|nr:rod shape-determining protein MreD [Treponema sp.]